MAAANEILGSALLGKSSFIPAARSSSLYGGEQSRPLFGPVLIRQGKRKLGSHVRKTAVAAPVVAAISERLGKVVADRPVKFKVRASVTVRRNKKESLKDQIANHLDSVADLFGQNVVLELVSTEIDPCTRSEKKSGEAVLRDWAEKMGGKSKEVVCAAEFTVDSSFGLPGAIAVANNHRQEFFLESVVVEGFLSGPIHFSCHSWVQPIKDYPDKRVFFSDKPYLPSETPAGLRELREEELKALRGDGAGAGERRLTDRVFDYATYNDLGNPDKGSDWVRPTLGGRQIPYPRRCRTGRPPTNTVWEGI